MAITSPEIPSTASNTAAMVLPQATMHIPPTPNLHQDMPERVKTIITTTPTAQQSCPSTIITSSTTASNITNITAPTPSPLDVQATTTTTEQFFNLPITRTAPLANTKPAHIPPTKRISRPKHLARFLDQVFVEPDSSKAKLAWSTSKKSIMSPECRLDGMLVAIGKCTTFQKREVNRGWDALQARLSRWDERSATGELKDADLHRFWYQLSDGYSGGSLEASSEEEGAIFMRVCEDSESDAVVLSDDDLEECVVSMAGAQETARLRRVGRMEDLRAEYRVGL